MLAAMTVPNMAEKALAAAEAGEEVRHCLYRKCRAVLPPASGPGRPRSYCKDGKEWTPDGERAPEGVKGKTCQQMAAAENAATKVTGLDGVLEAHQAAAEGLQPVLEDVRTRLEILIAAGDDIETAAVARIITAEQERNEERAARAKSDAAAEQERAHRVAADKQAAADREKAKVSDRLARDAEREKQERIAEMWDKVVAAEEAKGIAEGKAAAEALNRQAHEERYQKLAEDFNKLRDRHAEAERTLTGVRKDLEAAKKVEEQLRADAETAAGDYASSLDAERARHRAELEAERAQHQKDLGAAADLRAEDRRRLDELQAKYDQAVRDLDAERTQHQQALQAEWTQHQEQVDGVRAEERGRVEELQRKLDKAGDDLNAAGQRAAAAEGRAEGLQNEVSALRDTNGELHRKLGAVEPELVRLRQQVDQQGAEKAKK